MKKIIVVFVIITMTITQTVTVFATQNENDSVFNTHLLMIENDIANQETDFSHADLFEEKIRDKDYCLEDGIIKYNYVECMDSQDTKEKLYKMESIFILPKEGELDTLLNLIKLSNSERKEDSSNNSAEIMKMSSNYNHRESADSSGSIRGYVNVYFSESVKDKNQYMKIIKVSGGYKRIDQSVSVRAQSVTVSQKGRTYNHGYRAQQKTVSKGRTASWSVMPDKSWYAVNTDAVAAFVGAYCKYTLKRAGSSKTWKFTTDCPVVTNPVG